MAKKKEYTPEEIAAALSLGIPVEELRSQWGTPQAVFDWANKRWGPFDLDVAAGPWNTKCEWYYTMEDNALAKPWRGRCWCNPPWNNIDPFIRRGLAQVQSLVADLVCFFVPTRTGQTWWTEVVEPYGQVTLIEGRVPFDPPPGVHDAGGGFEDACYVVFERRLRAKDLLGPGRKRKAA